MTRYLLILLFAVCGITSQAQQRKETYYEDFYLTKRVGAPEANFKKVVTKNADGIVNTQIFDLYKKCILKDESFKDDKPVGVWTTYSKDCSVERVRDFSKLIYSDKEIDTLFNNVINKDNSDNYEKAQFGDSEQGITRYLVSVLKYPAEAKTAGATGIVNVQFIIKADGSVKMVSIDRPVNAYLDYESWELIENMPKWKPAKKNGQVIDSFYKLPIKFQLK